MKSSNDSNTYYLPLIMAAALALFMASEAAAFDFSVFAEAPPELLECLETKLGSEQVKSLVQGNRPSSRKNRKTIKKAYATCVGATGKGLPEGVTQYTGPLFDAMSQIDETVDKGQAIQGVRKAGVKRLGLFARSRKKLHQNEGAVLDLAEQHPDLIVLGAPKYFQLSGDLTTTYINATVEGIKKHGYRFIGEILYTHGDKSSGKQYSKGERYVDPSRPGTAKLLQAIAPLDIPLMTHWEPYAPARDFPRFHALYDTWPNQTFIVPHMGFASPQQVDEFLGRHPNLHMVISKKERVMNDFSDPDKQAAIGSALLDGFKLRPEWKEILIRYQDQLLFGTDPHMKKLWERYGEIIKSQRFVLGQLPPDVAQKIAYKNAARMYGISMK